MTQKRGSQQRGTRVAGSEESRALLAEARAWRRAAVCLDRFSSPESGLATALRAVCPDAQPRSAMSDRLTAHWSASPFDVAFMNGPHQRDERVLAALFMALEAEDESRSLRCQEDKR